MRVEIRLHSCKGFSPPKSDFLGTWVHGGHKRRLKNGFNKGCLDKLAYVHSGTTVDGGYLVPPNIAYTAMITVFWGS